MSHFRNALCCRQHYHGVQKATCSIDTLAELYYYGVYPYDRQRNENGGSELFAALINLCRMRESYGSICEVRENLWNYLVHNVRGFSPKGTSSAEIIQAFDNFKDLSGKFLVEYHVRSNCSSCGHFCRLSIELDPVHYFDHGVNSSHPGSLHSGLEFIVDRAIRYKSRDMRCDQCYSSLASVTETEIKMPNFLLVQLPVDKQSKNMQNPHPVICESMSVKGTTYKLTGAVQVLPGHFYGVVKHRNEYWVLDDLKDMPLKFPSFAGAVIRQKNLHSTILHVNKGHDGVHILLYARDWKDASVIREARSLPPPQSKWQHSPPPTLFTPDSSCYDEDFPRMEKNESPMKKHSKRHKRTVFRQPDISTPKKVKRTGDVTGKGHVDSLKCSPARERGKTVNLQHSSNNTQLGTQRRRKIISVKNHKNVGEPLQEKKEEFDSKTENLTKPEEDAPHQTRQKSWDKSKASDGEPVLGEKADLDFEEENSSNVKEDAPHQTTQKSWDKSKASDGEPNLGEKADLDFEQENDSNVGNTLHEGKENTYEENQTTYGEPTPEENAGQNAGQGTPLNSEKGNTPDEKSKRFYASNVSQSIEKVVEKKLCDILGHSVVTTHFCGELYLSCDIFRIAGFNISKCGYTQFDKILDEYYHHENPAFLLLGTKRTWVFSDALITILRQKQKQRKAKRERIALVLHELMKMKSSQEQSHAHANKDVPNANQSSKTNESQEPTKTDEHDLTFRNVVKYFSLFGKQIPCYLYAERVWLDISEIFQYVGFSPNIKKRGWKYVDACLKTQGIDPQYAFDHLRNRRCITIQGLEILLKKCKIGDKRQKMEVLEELRTEWDELASSRLQTLHLYKSEKSDMNTCKSSAEKSKEKSFRNKQGNVILCEEQWKNEKAVYDMYKSLHPVSGEDLVHLSDNFSGIRLMNQLRKAIPGILPSYAEEVEVKRQYKESFSCILSPQRTSTGWIIDPSRLLEVLSFKYPYIEDKLCIKLWGDGREIGGRHSTSLALSLLNHDLYLHNVLYQSPDHIYPFSIFYESDSRENLEENLAKYNVCEKLMRVCDASDIYLSGDEMFLIKILDGSSVLSPTSQKGWNFYHECAKEDKAQVAESGLRTDRPVLLDRKHPESLLPCIPLCNIVFDPMHGFTRIVEKLLILEVEKILYESNKNEQKTGTSSKTVLLENLTTNINNRGVRQGNFQIHFDKSGNPEPISLNKSHALSIVGIIRNDGSDDYPHVLHNVVPKRKLPLKTQEKIKEHFQHDLPCITEYDLAAQIYDTIFLMYNILKEEPGPILLDGKPEGSLRQQDYCWGYQEQTKLQYKALAERFYTLFCVRFTWQNFTPYMVKFVDYARYFMDYLHFPMNRFLTEGGEHINYIHSSYYFQHTTRHGGKYKVDPQLNFLIAMFRKLSYDIRQGEAAEEFTLYAKKHVSACKIQAFFRGYSVRKLLRERGWCPRPINENEVNRNESVLEDLHVHSGTFRTPLRELHENLPLFHGKTFILSGFVPSAHGKKWTQESLGEKIISLGGRVRKMLPGKTKGRSTKVYYLLVNTAGVKRSKKVPDIIYEAFIRRCILLDYKYIFDCLDSSCNLSTKEYEADFRDSLGHTSQQKPLHAIHFSRKKSVASLLRKKRMKKEGLKVLKKTCPVSPAVLYAHLKRREQIENTCTRIPFQEHGKLLKKYCEEFKGLPSAEKEHYRSLWNSRKRESIESNIEREKIKRYNKISSPLYKTLR